MDDNLKQVSSSYQQDQDILDARGIKLTVEEVAGLPTSKYTETVQSLNLNEDDLMCLKALRRRIRNRLASQNSRRRSVENLRRLTRELRAVRACRDDALAERRVLLATRTALRSRYGALRDHIMKILSERSDPTKVPELDPEIVIESPKPNMFPSLQAQIFECRLDKLVQQSVNHIYKEDKALNYKKESDKMDTVNYKLDRHNETQNSDKYTFRNDIRCDFGDTEKEDFKNGNQIFKTGIYMENGRLSLGEEVIKADKVCAKTVFIDGVLNLSKRKSHGRKQSAPRRITYVFSEADDDGVLDLKIKKEPE